jgi:hypothetical protein
VSSLIDQLASCFGSQRICGIVYDHTQPYAQIFPGEQTSDLPSVEHYKAGASYALMASPSFSPSPRSKLEDYLALTPGEGKPDRPFKWHGWLIGPTGEVRTVDLSNESTTAIHTNPRSMAAALWNLYAAKFSATPFGPAMFTSFSRCPIASLKKGAIHRIALRGY